MRLKFAEYNNGRKGLGFVKVPTFHQPGLLARIWAWLWEPVI